LDEEQTEQHIILWARGFCNCEFTLR
jgi:hypothetical protein